MRNLPCFNSYRLCDQFPSKMLGIVNPAARMNHGNVNEVAHFPKRQPITNQRTWIRIKLIRQFWRRSVPLMIILNICMQTTYLVVTK